MFFTSNKRNNPTQRNHNIHKHNGPHLRENSGFTNDISMRSLISNNEITMSPLNSGVIVPDESQAWHKCQFTGV